MVVYTENDNREEVVEEEFRIPVLTSFPKNMRMTKAVCMSVKLTALIRSSGFKFRSTIRKLQKSHLFCLVTE